jgi:hypothetical protein
MNISKNTFFQLSRVTELIYKNAMNINGMVMGSVIANRPLIIDISIHLFWTKVACRFINPWQKREIKNNVKVVDSGMETEW